MNALPTRFERFIPDRPADGCWPWAGAASALGYGYVKIDGRTVPAHRAVYEQLVGPIPTGLELDHLCRHPVCVNPAHLEPVTHAENLRRGLSSNRAKTHCPKGHAYTEANTYRYRGRRLCRACNKVGARREARAAKSGQAVR